HRWTATLSIRMPHARQAFRFADLRDVLPGSVMARRAARGALVPVLLSTALGGSAAAGPLALDEALARARAASPALRAAAAELGEKLAAERLALASRLAEAARRRTRAGETGALDARLAEVETARAAQETTAAEAEHARAEGRLATAIGAEPGEPLSASVEDM